MRKVVALYQLLQAIQSVGGVCCIEAGLVSCSYLCGKPSFGYVLELASINLPLVQPCVASQIRSITYHSVPKHKPRLEKLKYKPRIHIDVYTTPHLF